MSGPIIELPYTYNLPLYQYADFISPVFTWYAGGSLVNLSGWSAQLMIRNAPTDPSPLVSISTTPNLQGLIALGGAAGTIQFQLYHAVYPAALLVGEQGYTMLLTDTMGNVNPLLIGGAAVYATNVH